MQPEPLEIGRDHGRAFRGAYRGELSDVSEEYQPAVVACEHILHEVLKQIDIAFASVSVTYHRGFVYDKHAVGHIVSLQY